MNAIKHLPKLLGITVTVMDIKTRIHTQKTIYFQGVYVILYI